jgi:hypothetical protein
MKHIKKLEEFLSEGYKPMTDTEKIQKQYKDQQLQRLKDADKNRKDRDRLLALQKKKHEADRKASM